MISIIITSYNVSKTIGKAIESCLSQTFQDIEVIIVDDCSTDNSIDIIKSYKDSRIRLIQNDKNVGAGLSRRIGTKEANGEYITFLDGDDWYDDDFIQTMYEAALEYDADVVSTGMKMINSKGEITSEEFVSNTLEKYDRGVEAIAKSQSWMKAWLNNKLIKRTLWDEVEYSHRRFIEDTPTSYMLMFISNVNINMPYIGYNYFDNEKSLMNTATQTKHCVYRTLASIDICNFLRKKSELQHFKEFFHIFVNNYTNMLCELYKDESNFEAYSKEIEEVNEFIEQYHISLPYPLLKDGEPLCELILSNEKKCLFCIISKDECEPIVSSLLKYDFNEEYTDKKLWLKAISDKLSNNHLLFEYFTASENDKFKDYKKIIVLSNPLDRYISFVNHIYNVNEYNYLVDKQEQDKVKLTNQILMLWQRMINISSHKYSKHAIPQRFYYEGYKTLFGNDLNVVFIEDLPNYYKELTGNELISNNFMDDNEHLITKDTMSEEQKTYLNHIIDRFEFTQDDEYTQLIKNRYFR